MLSAFRLSFRERPKPNMTTIKKCLLLATRIWINISFGETMSQHKTQHDDHDQGILCYQNLDQRYLRFFFISSSPWEKQTNHRGSKR
mmetsp:Transcript_41803/g.75268  ORF Transcript_41803/g.75268 Transcript_41803/m.75268 type:complete len:87 (-) Transcript_41803:790-1050(-)